MTEALSESGQEERRWSLVHYYWRVRLTMRAESLDNARLSLWLRAILLHWSLTLCIVLANLSVAYQAQAFQSVIAEPGLEKYRFQNELYYFDNSQEQKTAESILSGALDHQFTKHNKYGLDFGHPKQYIEGDYWLGFQIENNTGQDLALYIPGSAKPSLSKVYFIKYGTPTPDHIVEIEKDYNRANLNINVSPGHWKIYIKVNRDVFGFHIIFLSLRSYNNIIQHSPDRHFISISLGVCIALLIYNLVLAMSLRSRSHYLYVCYNLSIVLYFEGNSQILATHFGLYEIPLWAMLPISSCSIYFFMIFIYSLLDISRNLPQWKWLFRCIFTLWPIIIILHFFDHQRAIQLLNFVILSSVPISIVVGSHAIIKRVPIARMLLITILLPAIGSFIGLQSSIFSAWLPIVLIASAQPLGIDLEMIFLSMIVGYKIRKEHQSLRNKRDHAYNELKKIVFPHQVEKVWEGRSLESTMPVGKSQAYSIVFDVISSSKMTMDNPRAFLSGIFNECSKIMMERYDGQHLIANAYRVKELGDGFLCTVGFPFASPNPAMADHSFELALQFIQVFAKQAQRVDSSQPIHCCVGIAYGTVEAFYPDSGTKAYDLFGKGIILAHRYESMRDVLWPFIQQKTSLIIIQKTVFDKLAKGNQENFVTVELKSSQLSVRDDEDATHIYYQSIAGEDFKQEDRIPA